MKYRQYDLDGTLSDLEKIREKFKPPIGFYQSVEFAYTVKILEMGKPIYFINENNSVCILGYVTLKPNKQLFIIRPEYIKDLFELIAEIRSDYDEITIVTDEKNIIRQYINKVKRASYFVTPIISLEQGMNQVIENFSREQGVFLKGAGKPL